MSRGGLSSAFSNFFMELFHPPPSQYVPSTRETPRCGFPAALRRLPPASSSANRARLAGGPGDGNECPWSPHGGGEILARRPGAASSSGPTPPVLVCWVP